MVAMTTKSGSNMSVALSGLTEYRQGGRPEDLRRVVELSTLRRILPTPDTLRRIRLDAGVALEDVAREVNVARSTVSRWERGKRTPRREHLRVYVQVLMQLAAIAAFEESRDEIEAGPS